MLTTDSPKATGDTPAASVVKRVPFRAATFEVTRRNQRVQTVLSATAQQLVPIDVPSGGYIANIPILITVTSAGNAAAVAAHADAPWSVIDQVWLENPNGGYLVGPISGYELFCAQKYGGYYFDDDPVRSALFTAMVVGAGATGGTFQILFDFPIRAVDRDAIAAFGNGNASAVPRLVVTLAPLAKIYSTAPTNAPTVVVEAFTDEFAQPKAEGPRGPNEQVPVGFGSLSRWTKQQYTVNVGENTHTLQQRGNWYRNLIFIFRSNAANTPRDDTVLGATFNFTYEDRPVFDGPAGLLRHKMQRRYGYLAANLDAGVYVYDYCHEFDGKPGGELRDQWLATTTASRNMIKHTATTAGTLTVLTNDIVVPDTQLVVPA